MNLNDDFQLYDSKQAANALQISERTLWSLTVPRGPLPCVRIGKSVRYDLADIKMFINSNKQTAFDKCNPIRKPDHHGQSVNK